MNYVIRMTTDKGEFWWDSAAVWERQVSSFRLWGWRDDLYRAQRYVTAGNAQRQAQRLRDELGRLYTIRVDVVQVEITALGVNVVEGVANAVEDEYTL